MAVINIDIIFDFVCAWCYIGKRTLDKAIRIYQKTYPGGKNDIFNITWRPYYLNYTRLLLKPEELSAGGVTGSSSSSLPSTGIDDVHSITALPTVDKSEVAKIKLAHLSDEQVAKIEKRVNQIGRSLGIGFRSGGKVGSTRAAHHLIHLAQRENLVHKEGNGYDDEEEPCNTSLISRLFEAYHELEMDISARDVLRKIAVDDARLKPVEIDECLDFCFDSSPSPDVATVWSVATANGDGVESVVDKEARKNRQRTSTGVPLFIVQGEYRVEGAQDLMEFVEIFGKIREAVDESALNI